MTFFPVKTRRKRKKRTEFIKFLIMFLQAEARKQVENLHKLQESNSGYQMMMFHRIVF